MSKFRFYTAVALVVLTALAFVQLSGGASGDAPSGFETPTPAPTTPGPSPFPTGDVTCDHVVDVRDVIELLRRIAGLEHRPACPPSAPAAAAPQSDGSSVTLRLEPHFESVAAGSEFPLSIEATLTDASLGAYRAFVSYDPRKLMPTSCTEVCNLAWSENTVALVGENVSGWMGTAIIGSVSFKALADHDRTTVSLNADEVSDVNGEPLAACLSAGGTYGFEPAAASGRGAGAPQGFQTATPSPVPPTPTPVVTPAPPVAYPCDYWLPASLGCEVPVETYFALIVLRAIAFHTAVIPPSCPILGGK
jgi:hypothetical protein